MSVNTDFISPKNGADVKITKINIRDGSAIFGTMSCTSAVMTTASISSVTASSAAMISASIMSVNATSVDTANIIGVDCTLTNCIVTDTMTINDCTIGSCAIEDTITANTVSCSSLSVSATHGLTGSGFQTYHAATALATHAVTTDHVHYEILQCGRLITINFTALESTNVATASSIAIASILNTAYLSPMVDNLRYPCFVEDNTTIVDGYVLLSQSGTISWMRANAANFTNSGKNGFCACSVSYIGNPTPA